MKDKKKLIALVALVLVIVSVGVFQFVSAGSNAPAPAVAKKEEKKAPEPEKVEAPKNALFAQNLPPRDPFQATSLPQQPPPQAKQEPPRPTPPVQQLPPMQIDKSGSFGTAPVLIQKAPEATFEFSLSGIMLGAKPMAVFTDPQGNQRLVLLGGSLDPDSKVVSIDKDTVTVRFHGKTLRLTVEGNPNAK